MPNRGEGPEFLFLNGSTESQFNYGRKKNINRNIND